jgi:hypothetical protein
VVAVGDGDLASLRPLARDGLHLDNLRLFDRIAVVRRGRAAGPDGQHGPEKDDKKDADCSTVHAGVRSSSI